VCCKLSGLWKDLLQQRDQRGPAHQEASRKQYTTDAQRAQAFNLSIAAGESLGGRLQRPAHGREGEHIANKVGKTVYRVGKQCCSLLADFPIQHISDTHPGC
jgi:hypothetical protein